MQAWESVLDTAVEKEYIKARDLDVPLILVARGEELLRAMRETLPAGMKAAGPGQLTFPIIRSLFVFAFIKGFEAGCRREQHDAVPCDAGLKDMLTGSVEVDLTREMADYANARPVPDELFFAFQNWAFENRERIDSGKANLEDEMFAALQRVFGVGVTVAMEFEG